MSKIERKKKDVNANLTVLPTISARIEQYQKDKIESIKANIYSINVEKVMKLLQVDR